MPKFILLILFFSCALNHAVAQKVDIKPFIETWSVADESQTHKAEETYSDLKQFRDTVKFHQTLDQLYTYLKKNPNDRLWVRTTMYDVFGKIELGLSPRSGHAIDASRVLACIKIASKLHDDQLKAELYALYAEVASNPSNYALYNLKAIELQQKVGVSKFKFVANRYYNVAFGLYQNEDYRQSINYGLKFFSLKNEETRELYPYLFILINDVVGSSYHELGLLDSTRYYYQKIIDTLIKKPHPDPEIQQIWLAIAKGSIGKTFVVENRIKEALPLINEYLNTSLKLKYFSNAASAENILGGVYLDSKQYQKAKTSYNNAYRYAKVDNVLKEKSIACKGLADVFRATKETDSAFVYYALHQKFKDALTAKINGGKLSTLNASIAFDNMEVNLQEANHSIKSYQLTRNLILAGIVLLTIIALLFYNRKMLQQKNMAANLLHRQKMLAQEAKQAKIEVKKFIVNIADKNKLITDLQEKLTTENIQINDSLLNYTLVTDEEWDSFRLEFAKAHPKFFPSLKEYLANINPAEERLAALLCLKVTSHQIANTLGISKDSVGRSKRRLKQRLNLPVETQLEDFICKLS